MENIYEKRFKSIFEDRLKSLILNVLNNNVIERSKINELIAFKNYEEIIMIIHDKLDSIYINYINQKFYIYDTLDVALEKNDLDAIVILLSKSVRIFQLSALADIIERYLTIEGCDVISEELIEAFDALEEDIKIVNNMNDALFNSYAFDLLQIKNKQFSKVKNINSVFEMSVVAENVHEILLDHLRSLIDGNNISEEDIAAGLENNDAKYLMEKFAILKKCRDLYTCYSDGLYNFESSIDEYRISRKRNKESVK